MDKTNYGVYSVYTMATAQLQKDGTSDTCNNERISK